MELCCVDLLWAHKLRLCVKKDCVSPGNARILAGNGLGPRQEIGVARPLGAQGQTSRSVHIPTKSPDNIDSSDLHHFPPIVTDTDSRHRNAVRYSRLHGLPQDMRVRCSDRKSTRLNSSHVRI